MIVDEKSDSSEICDIIASELTKGKITGWFQGGSEYGPRALGHRSILADPRPEDMKDRVNRKIKFRESFRPFAPSVLLEHVAEFFDTGDELPFMLNVVEVRKEKRDEIPAVVHKDGTARPQTVRQNHNPLFYRLIEAFRKLTGIPLLLNTSFNLAGEPIVETPEDALRTFYLSDMDLLVIKNRIIKK